MNIIQCRLLIIGFRKSFYSHLVLYILADLISFLEIQRSQIAGSSSTVFAVNLITCCNAYQLHSNRTQNQLSIYVFSRNATVNIAVKFYKKWLPILGRGRLASYYRLSTWRNSKRLNTRQKLHREQAFPEFS